MTSVPSERSRLRDRAAIVTTVDRDARYGMGDEIVLSADLSRASFLTWIPAGESRHERKRVRVQLLTINRSSVVEKLGRDDSRLQELRVNGAVTRWGIVGTGWLSQRVMSDLRATENVHVGAVSSRSQVTANRFASKRRSRGPTVNMSSFSVTMR